MNRSMLYLSMFEYTLRPKDLVDLLGCMYLTFKNRSLYAQAIEFFLTGAQNWSLDFGQLLRNISETEKPMREINGSAFHFRTSNCSTWCVIIGVRFINVWVTTLLIAT